MDETALRELLDAACEIPQMLGGKKIPLSEEQPTIDFAFATVVSIDNIKAGESFTMKNLWVKRPGTGEVIAEDFESILGRKAACDIIKDTQLRREMISQ